MENVVVSNFMLALDRITKNTKRVIDSVLKDHGLRSTHASCFFRICEFPDGLSSSQLASACGVDKAFISRITAELIEGDYIIKDPGPKGIIYKRKYILTEKGKAVYKALTDALTGIIAEVNHEIPAEKLAIFDEVLNSLDKGIIDYLKGGI
ncbi:MAG: hypothetical protein IJX51_09255 [Clostridia bacterium]|nr:hypothetical protein [Clostridia bacterium]